MSEKPAPQLVVPHRRQFVLCDIPIERDGWTSERTAWGQILSWQTDLAVTADPEARHYTLGTGWQDGAAGRHVTLRDGILSGDSMGLAMVLYGEVQGRPLITSSPALAAELSGQPARPRRFSWQIRPNWFFLPQSPVIGFKRLLRDQALDTRKLSIEALDRPILPFGSMAEAEGALSTHLVDFFNQFDGKRIVLSLTAGLDSRTVLAGAVASGVPVEALTLDIGPKAAQDIKMARKLCRFFGIRHIVARPQSEDLWRADADALRRHCLDANHDGINAISVPRGLYRSLAPDSVLVRGCGFEFRGDSPITRSLAGLPMHGTRARDICERLRIDHLQRPEILETTAEWLDWRQRHDNGLALNDHFYLDQRLGGWLAMGDFCHDALPALPVQPANADVVLSALVTGRLAERSSGQVQIRAIHHLVPALERFAINPRPLGTRLRGLGGRILSKAARQPDKSGEWRRT
jgi:hypothetical protein